MSVVPIRAVVLIQLSILWTSCCIDYLLVVASHPDTSYPIIVRVALDESAHLLLPPLVWLLSTLSVSLDITASNGSVIDLNKDMARLYVHAVKYRIELFASMLVGVIIDIDHFVEARSLSLFAATHLNHRPIGHSLLCCIVVVLMVRLMLKDSRTSHLVLSGYVTHLLRDATRRGLWIGQEFLGGGRTVVTSPLPVSAVLLLYCVVIPLTNR